MSQVEKGITHADVRESIAVAKSHGEKFFEQIVWQVENEVWTILGYSSWDELREAEYADLGIVAPRADRPELATRLRAKGLTQKEIASTIGVDQRTAGRILNRQTPNEDAAPATIMNSRGQERPARYQLRDEPTFDPTPAWDPTTGEVIEPRTVTRLDGKTYSKPDPKEAVPVATHKRPRRPIYETTRVAITNLVDATETLGIEIHDDRFPTNAEELTPMLRNQLTHVIETCQGYLDALNPNKE